MPGRMVIHDGVRYSPKAAREAGIASDEPREGGERAKRQAAPVHDKARRTTKLVKGADRGRDATSEG